MARRHTPEQVIAKVRQGQKMLNDGRPMVEVIKELMHFRGHQGEQTIDVGEFTGQIGGGT